MKISYCIMCKGRAHHLKETLPRNLEVELNNKEVEFVILDYDSQDDLADWIREGFQSEIASGRIVYVHYAPAPAFKMAHAKNLSHRLASGDILCNLDADNIIAKDFSLWLNRMFENNGDAVVSPVKPTIVHYFRNRWIDKRLGFAAWPEGLNGRIAITRENFLRLGGYEEGFSAWGMDDIDFICRARDLGLPIVLLPSKMWGSVLKHDHEARLANLSDEDKKVARGRLQSTPWSQIKRRLGQLWITNRGKANGGRPFGIGSVKMNFSEDVVEIE